MSARKMRTRFGSAWAPAILLVLGVIFMISDGTTGDSGRGAEGSAARRSEELQLATVFELPTDRHSDDTRAGIAAQAHPSSTSPFPILPLVGVILLVMTLALHHAAWRWAH